MGNTLSKEVASEKNLFSLFQYSQGWNQNMFKMSTYYNKEDYLLAMMSEKYDWVLQYKRMNKLPPNGQ